MRSRLTIQAIDLHCGGEPLRLITSGYPPVPRLPILERRAWVRDHADHVRRVVCFEPRGHRDMYGAVLMPPFRDDADLAVLFMHNEGYSTMCGHGIIALGTALVEEGLWPWNGSPEVAIRFETPAGLVVARVAVRPDDTGLAGGDSPGSGGASGGRGASGGGVAPASGHPSETADTRGRGAAGRGDARGRGAAPRVDGVRFTNVPSYVAAQELALVPDGLDLAGPAAARGSLSVDIGFGGAYYGIVDATELGLRVIPSQVEQLTRAGAAITAILRRDHTVEHPHEPDLGFIYGTIIVDRTPATSPDGRGGEADVRNVTVFAEAEVDRSPCGTGTCALLAQSVMRGDSDVGSVLRNASITGAMLEGRVEARSTLGSHKAIVPSVAGNAYVTGHASFFVDARDPLGDGFLLR